MGARCGCAHDGDHSDTRKGADRLGHQYGSPLLLFLLREGREDIRIRRYTAERELACNVGLDSAQLTHTSGLEHLDDGSRYLLGKLHGPGSREKSLKVCRGDALE